MEITNALAILDQLPIHSWSYPRILVGILVERSISYADDVFMQFLRIAQQGPSFSDVKYGRTDVTRNIMATQLLESNYTHLLMLDVDHVHPTDIIQRLARWVLLMPEVQVVSGMNFRRGEPFDPVAGSYEPDARKRSVMTEWTRGLIKVHESGAASLLVAREVFEKLEPPWFFNIYDEVWRNSYPGEDIGFSRKCRAAGIPIYVDTTTSSPHCTTVTITEETFRAYMEAHPERFKNE